MKTYEELVSLAKLTESRQNRYLYKTKAEKVYPDRFNIKDFTKDIYIHANYEDLREYFNNTDKPAIKTNCKKLAMTKFAAEFNPEDFKRKTFKRKK